MILDRFLIKLGLAFVAVFAAMYLVQNPGLVTGKLSKTEIDHYLGLASQQIPFPPDRKEPILKAVRAWAEADDGKAFYMLNVMRFYDTVKKIPGAPQFQGTPVEANAYYESKTASLLVLQAGSAPLITNTQGRNVISSDSDATELDNWSRILLVRYPNRRAFLNIISDPRYAPLAPYKAMALEFLLIPLPDVTLIPDLHVIVGVVLLFIFVLVGWARARRPPP
jgi:hypothetical protein